ncbi:hypothetical protein D3C72_2470500 [compost metagenome]
MQGSASRYLTGRSMLPQPQVVPTSNIHSAAMQENAAVSHHAARGAGRCNHSGALASVASNSRTAP